MKTKRIPVNKITELQLKSLFELMERYYSGMFIEQFIQDFKSKDEVILLLSNEEKIVGFSTVQKMELTIEDKKVLALFSGDTVLEKEFWGNGALGFAFARYLVRVKIQNMWTPTYWFLISKGYKTYLLMTNNFSCHFPRYDKKTPDDIQDLMDKFYRARYFDSYVQKSGTIHPQKGNVFLKVDVAEIDQNMLLMQPKIKFFNETNPKWREGAELACIARVDVSIPLKYVFKRCKKIFILKKEERLPE